MTVGAGAGAAVAAYGTAAVATAVATELAEEAFEAATGIPVIVDPFDVAQQSGKRLGKNCLLDPPKVPRNPKKYQPGGGGKPAGATPTKDAPPAGWQPQQAQQQQGNGSYINTHKSGKPYAGKGGEDRMKDSAKEKAEQYNDPVVTMVHKPAVSEKQSFIDEQNAIEAIGGPGGNTYNKINSPGKKLRDCP